MIESSDLVAAALEAEVRDVEGTARRGDYAGALKAYRRILTDRLATHDGLVGYLLAADLVVVDRLADLSVLFGLFDAADDLFQAIAALTRSKGNDIAADYAQLKRAELSLARGAVRNAFDRLRELEARTGDIAAFEMSIAGFARWEQQTAWQRLPPADREILFSRTYYLFVRLLASIGQYVHGINAAERSEVHTGSRAADLAQQARLPIALARASALFESGDLDQADGALRSLRRAAQDASQPSWRVMWLELRGRLDLAWGDFAGASARFDDVLHLCQGGGFRQAAVAANLNRAHLLILLNRIREALGHIENAEQDAYALGDRGALARARFLRSVADARRRSLAETVSLELSVTEMLRRGRRAAAPSDDVGAADELIDVPQSPNFLTLFEDRALQVQWLIAQGRLNGAQSLLAELKSEQVFGATPSRLIRTRLDVLQGLLAYYHGEPRAAMAVLAAAAGQLATMRLKPELWQALRLQGWCAAQLGQKAEEQAFVEHAERILEEIANSLDGAERAIFLLNKWTAEEEYLAGEIAHLVVEKAAILRSHFFARPFAWLKMARRLNSLMVRIDRHKALVAKSAVGSAAPAMRREPSLLRRMLTGTHRRLVISFLVLPDRILVVHAGLGHLDFHVSATTRIELREQVRRWHERMRASSTVRDLTAPPLEAQPGEAVDLAQPLADALQLRQLFDSLPARTTELAFVPDDALHGFPFASMLVGDKQLIDRFAISTQFETGPMDKPKPVGPSTALLVAVSRGGDGIPPLPQTVKEVERVRSWLGERGIVSELLVDDDATKSRVLESMRKAKIFHIACHGRFVPDRPDASGMLLIPGHQRTEMLSLRDLAQMQLLSCEHATLSSCWSADNFILPGRRIVSLPETLYRAGARSILACVWPVDDRVAEHFLTRFYAHAGTLSRAEALRRTQIECRSRVLPECGDIDTSDPFYWAGFNLFGEAGRLDL